MGHPIFQQAPAISVLPLVNEHGIQYGIRSSNGDLTGQFLQRFIANATGCPCSLSDEEVFKIFLRTFDQEEPTTRFRMDDLYNENLLEFYKRGIEELCRSYGVKGYCVINLKALIPCF